MRVVNVKFIVWVYSMNLSRTFEALLIRIDGLLLRSTVCGQRIAHRKSKETNQEPGNRLGCCLVSFHFLCAVLCPQAVL